MQAPSRYAPLYFRTDRPASVWLETLRATVAELDREVLVSGETTLDREAEKLLAAPRFLTAILTGFALFAAAAVAKNLASQLHGVTPFDVVTFVGACDVMAAIGLLAVLWPARRAAQQDPLSALNEN
jgi:hypothetical protein